MMNKIVKCCDKLQQVIKEDIFIFIDRDQVKLQSDGGHGGTMEIEFCPFCGEEVTFIENESQISRSKG